MASSPDSPLVHHLLLRNCAQLLVHTRDDLDHVAVSFTIGFGYLDQESDEGGYAHLVEHLLCTDGRCSDLADFRWGVTHENTVMVHSSTLPDQLDLVLDLTARQLAEPELSDESISKELNLIEEEFRAQVASHPLRRFPAPQIAGLLTGQCTGLDALYGAGGASTARLTGFYQRWSTPRRLRVAVVGPVDAEAVRHMAEGTIGAVPEPPGAQPADRPLRCADVVNDHDPAVGAKGVAAAWLLPSTTEHWWGARILHQIFEHRPHAALPPESGALLGITGPAAYLRDSVFFGVRSLFHAPVCADDVLAALLGEIAYAAEGRTTRQEAQAAHATILSELAHEEQHPLWMSAALAREPAYRWHTRIDAMSALRHTARALISRPPGIVRLNTEHHV